MNIDDKDDFCLSIPLRVHSSDASSSSDEVDSDIEITSTFDAHENELIRIDDLCLNSDDSGDEKDLKLC